MEHRKSKSIVVVAPHCLDEILGCGGTVARHVKEGDQVNTIILFGDGLHKDAKRRTNAVNASKILESNPPIFLGFPENRSDTIALLDVVSVLERVFGELRPDVVYVNHGGNLNIDHQTTYKATVTALRPAPGCPTKAIYSYETLSSTDWAPPSQGFSFLPNRFIVIKDYLDRKNQALKLYDGDVRSAPHARSLNSLNAMATVRGHSMGIEASEAFMVLRQLKDQ
jgi:LmbE family N-acetylglucosaminyl deacetylase